MEQRKMWLLGVILIYTFLTCKGQGKKNDDQLNVIFVYQPGEVVALEAFEAVLKYLQEKNIEVYSQYHVRATGNGEAVKNLLCSVYNKSLDEKRPPHLILDMTRNSAPSVTTKSFSKLFGLPTVSGSDGQLNEFRRWSNLSPEMAKYLIRVNPPSDMITEVVRHIVYEKNIVNAGILFDPSFVMDHKYKSLLQNASTRHIINEINTTNVRRQLENFKRLELFNYFIIGHLGTIKLALDAGSSLNYYDRRFAWHTISLDRGIPTTNCDNCSFLHVKPIQSGDTRPRLNMLQKDYNLKGEPPIVASFYFDIMLQGILAANELKSQNAYAGWKYTYCNDNIAGMNNTRNLDLRTAFVETGMKEGSSYAPLTNGANGLNWQNFVTSIQKIDFENGKMKRSPQEIGVWRAGINSRIVIKNKMLF